MTANVRVAGPIFWVDSAPRLLVTLGPPFLLFYTLLLSHFSLSNTMGSASGQILVLAVSSIALLWLIICFRGYVLATRVLNLVDYLYGNDDAHGAGETVEDILRENGIPSRLWPIAKFYLPPEGHEKQSLRRNRFEIRTSASYRSLTIMFVCMKGNLLVACAGLILASIGLLSYRTSYEVFRALGWTLALIGFYVAYGGIASQRSTESYDPGSRQRQEETRAIIEAFLARDANEPEKL
jgi:hypothetical protein